MIGLFGGCHSQRSASESVDTALLRYLDEDGRRQVADARRLRDEAADAVAAARLDLQQARAELEIARQERDVAVARLDKARASAVMPASTPASSDPSAEPTPRATEGVIVESMDHPDVREARLGIGVADDRIAWRRASIDSEERRVELLEAREKHANAQVELAKAEALRRAGRPEVDVPALAEIERSVRNSETEARVAAIRLEAAKQEVERSKDRANVTIEERRNGHNVIEPSVVRERREDNPK